jgi:hypothetical protein
MAAAGPLVHEMHPDAIDPGPEVTEPVQPAFLRAPVEAVCPVPQQAPQVTEIGALLPRRTRRRPRPPRVPDPRTKVGRTSSLTMTLNCSARNVATPPASHCAATIEHPRQPADPTAPLGPRVRGRRAVAHQRGAASSHLAPDQERQERKGESHASCHPSHGGRSHGVSRYRSCLASYSSDGS